MQQVLGADPFEHCADGRFIEKVDDMRLRAGDAAIGLDDDGVNLGAVNGERGYGSRSDEAGRARDQDPRHHRT
jgi:hypothetical protein